MISMTIMLKLRPRVQISSARFGWSSERDTADVVAPPSASVAGAIGASAIAAPIVAPLDVARRFDERGDGIARRPRAARITETVSEPVGRGCARAWRIILPRI